MVDEFDDLEMSAEELASAIDRLSKATDAMLSAGLTKRAIVVLLRGQVTMRQEDIYAVLNALPRLRDAYLTKPETEDA